MRSPVRLCFAALAGALLVSGCALKDPRDSYSYSRVSDGLWDADYDLLLDWNFPTSANLGPIEAPQRFRPERPAIGVPWATGNPLQPADASQAPALDGASDAGSPPPARASDPTGHGTTQATRPADDVGGVRGAGMDTALTRR
jgi:hypothetical protein